MSDQIKLFATSSREKEYLAMAIVPKFWLHECVDLLLVLSVVIILKCFSGRDDAKVQLQKRGAAPKHVLFVFVVLPVMVRFCAWLLRILTALNVWNWDSSDLTAVPFTQGCETAVLRQWPDENSRGRKEAAVLYYFWGLMEYWWAPVHLSALMYAFWARISVGRWLFDVLLTSPLICFAVSAFFQLIAEDNQVNQCNVEILLRYFFCVAPFLVAYNEFLRLSSDSTRSESAKKRN